MKTNFPISIRALLYIVSAGASLWPRSAPATLPFDSLNNGCPFCGGAGLPTPDELGLPAVEKSKPAAPTASQPVQTLVPSAAVPSTRPAISLASRNGLTPPVEQGSDGSWRVSFLNLASFDFAVPSPNAPHVPGSRKDMPDSMSKLDGKRVVLSGHMLPIKIEKGRVTEFLLIRSPMVCCCGVAPAPNEWVVVKMKGPGTATVMGTPMNFYGTLRVGEIYEDDTCAGIYQLEGEKVAVN